MKIVSSQDEVQSIQRLVAGRAAAFMNDEALICGERAKAKAPSDWVVNPVRRVAVWFGRTIRNSRNSRPTSSQVIAGLMPDGAIKATFSQPAPPKTT